VCVIVGADACDCWWVQVCLLVVQVCVVLCADVCMAGGCRCVFLLVGAEQVVGLYDSEHKCLVLGLLLLGRQELVGAEHCRVHGYDGWCV
jgi:hypothetical protein